MTNRLLPRASVALLVVNIAGFTACSSDNGPSNGTGGGSGTGTGGAGGSAGNQSGGGNPGGGSPAADASDAPSYTYTIIDDMETTTHGPIEFAGVMPPMNPGYWFNFGADKPGSTSDPAQGSFTFTALPTSMTWNGKVSTHAAHQLCTVTAQYEVCGVGLEFAQVVSPDAGLPESGTIPTDASTNGDGGDAGPPIPMTTVPFDISAYKGITFWGKATAEAGVLDVKVQFPNTDTDPRGGVCNSDMAGAGGPTDTSQCYNSYASHRNFTVTFAELKIEAFGFRNPAPWDGKKVYGINWQAQKNSAVSAGPVTTDFWVDDVYFIQ
jgi:hypothetical protein